MCGNIKDHRLPLKAKSERARSEKTTGRSCKSGSHKNEGETCDTDFFNRVYQDLCQHGF